MQFICESCKANLQIADEKIQGKRLIVRCKRCGVQIRIVDPALVPSQSGQRPATGPIRASQSGGRPSTGPIARAAAPRRETDTESTRAMDSEVLEKALRASKAESSSPASAAPPPARSAPPPPPREPAQPRDPAIWFAMVQGKQAGPITRAELALKASASQVGPRTYVWKDGMESWIRAKDVPELVPLFAAPPTPPPPPREAAPAARRPEARERRVELPFETATGLLTPPSGQPAPPAGVDGEGAASPDAPTPPGGTRIPDVAGAAATPGPPADAIAVGERAQSAPGALDLARWGADELSKPRALTPEPLPKAPTTAAPARELRIGQPERRAPLRAFLVVVALALAGGLVAFALLSERKDGAPEAARQDAAAPGAAQAPAPAEGERRPEEKPAGAASGETPAGAPALGAEELKRKVDESKPVLQGCVDEAVKRDPALQAVKIVLSATVAPTGAVTSARIDQKAVDQSPLGACLKSAARRIQFPAFSGEPFAVDIPIVVTGAP